MKINFSLLFFFLSLLPFQAHSEAALNQMMKAPVIRCGTNLSVQTYAYKEKGQWKGFDADICRVFAWAIYGDGNQFTMVDVRPNQIQSAFSENKIDILLGGASFSAAAESNYNITDVGLLYYDRQMFATNNLTPDKKSMEDFKGKNICVYKDGNFRENLETYNQKYQLNLNIRVFPSFQKAREALLLRRCELITGSGTQLQDLLSYNYGKNLKILPEEFAHAPVYAYVSQNRPKLVTALKWLINGLYLAEDKDITQQNIKYVKANNDESVANLLGENDVLWRVLGLQTHGFRYALQEVGNMREIYDRNLGKDSVYQLERGNSNLIKNGGIVHAKEFR